MTTARHLSTETIQREYRRLSSPAYADNPVAAATAATLRQELHNRNRSADQ